MAVNKITVQSSISADRKKVWDYYTKPEHITQWNFADTSWHCPTAENDLRVGGRYCARMEAKDGSAGFDFEAIYTEMIEGEQFTYEFGGRIAIVKIHESGSQTEISVTFDAENENSIELQKGGWQAILNHFKNYAEAN